jgi:hypothetical protein
VRALLNFSGQPGIFWRDLLTSSQDIGHGLGE